MAGNLYILCPGQGAQVVGMGRDYYQRSPAARAVFDEARSVLGYDLGSVCFNGPAEKLDQTDVSQPAIYVTSVACFAAAVEAGLVAPGKVTAYAGLSLGEYTALHLGGAFTLAAGLRLVQARGRFMQEAGASGAGGMVCILGADETQVDGLCRETADGEVLVPANFNAPGQIVVSGTATACRRVSKGAEAAGFRAVALKVSGAFHSALMQGAAERMAGELDKADIGPAHAAVYANVTAAPHQDAASMKRLLVDQIVKPVRWEQTMRALLAEGAEGRFVELAPGRVLTGLLKKIDRRLRVENLGSAEAVLGGK
jgi:[acyl-carrier-protein] S-malonyltransferase